MRLPPPDDLFDAFLLLCSAIIVYFMFVGTVNAKDGPTLEALIEYSHSSDLLRGNAPWAKDKPEPSIDHIMAGGTITVGEKDRWEIDLLHGVRRIGDAAGEGKLEQGSVFRVRWYPGRGK